MQYSNFISTYFVLDHLFGYEEVTRQCGAKEVNGLIYEEGCETTKIPFKRKECYCKRSLCNSANHLYFRLFSRCNYVYGYLFEIAILKLEQFCGQEDTQPLSTKPPLIINNMQSSGILQAN